MTLRRPWPTLLATLLFGLVLIHLSLPRFAASLLAIPGNHVLERIQDAGEVTPAQLDRLIETREAAAEWVEDGRLFTDLALARLLLAERKGGDLGPDPAEAEKALDPLRQGLSLGPAQPFAWTRLAFAETLVDGPSQAAGAALSMAFETGRYEPRLTFVRLELGLANWDYLAEQARTVLGEHVLQTWPKEPELLANLALYYARPGEVRRILAAVPEQAAAFDALLVRLAEEADGK